MPLDLVLFSFFFSLLLNDFLDGLSVLLVLLLPRHFLRLLEEEDYSVDGLQPFARWPGSILGLLLSLFRGPLCDPHDVLQLHALQRLQLHVDVGEAGPALASTAAALLLPARLRLGLHQCFSISKVERASITSSQRLALGSRLHLHSLVDLEVGSIVWCVQEVLGGGLALASTRFCEWYGKRRVSGEDGQQEQQFDEHWTRIAGA